MRVSPWALVALVLVGCGSAGGAGDLGPPDLASDVDAGVDLLPPGPGHTIQHVVVVVQENHTFDNYFGRWCQAAAGSNPTCTDGPSCCEAAPLKDPSGASPVDLDDTTNAAYDPKHTQPCELEEMNGGAMDRYVTGASCSDPRNFAVAPGTAVLPYWRWAAEGALADRYFQPLVGQSSSNDMYFAVAQWVFTDNMYKPDAQGNLCALPATRLTLAGKTTIGDLMIQAGHGFAFYAGGYAAMLAAKTCPAPPPDCPAGIPTTPCNYDPSDNPFQFYLQFVDNLQYMKDMDAFFTDVDGGKLPTLSFIKPVQYKNEHPGYGTRISDGTRTVQSIVDKIAGSPYAADTLLLVTWDEGGGFFDHVAPPGLGPVDNQPYGTRVPLVVIGNFAKRGYVSHVQLEHSSILRFLEWNFLGEQTGQLGGRDTVVRSIGDLLDPTKTAVPPN